MTIDLSGELESVLVANRGEIALRVFRTCREHGIRTIAIFTDLDADAPHVRAADDAIRVESYLDIEAVVAAAVATGARAIHPGYGFLSERSAFVRAVVAAGVVFVGPSADVMDAMGRKDAAREIAVAAGVPVVPSFPLVEQGAQAPGSRPLAYPVLVKAASGGGGKGMRVVRSADEYDEAVAAAEREALSAFGDDTMLVEKYVERGRHIEVQILADAHGNVVHFGERDCSTQRRHQKVLEEAPAPTISDAVRELVTTSAVALARQVGYTSAGTVEFLLDDATGEAYFLEMNTRLQVEHPVTEAVFDDYDLVLDQLLIALGRRMEWDQASIRPRGHAIEARVYAEDSFGGFLPQAGTTSLVRWPENARVDHALESGQVVSTAYDPMLGKVIVHGPVRESARRAMVAALDATAILGLTTNVGFLRALVAGDEFRDATIDTAWLDRNSVEAPAADVARVAVAWVSAMLAEGDATHPFHADGWRGAGEHAPVQVQLDRMVRVDRVHGRVDDHDVVQVSAENHVLVLTVDGVREQVVVNVQPTILEAVHHGQRFVFERPDPFAERGPAAGDGALLAAMPGTVLAVDVAEGDLVVAGQRLGVLEAMKMELALKAPFDGTVALVGAAVGDQVALKQVLFLVEKSEVSA
ncbi:MAG: Carbamoyl-phosphate synthase chain, ATP-binding protein [Marmoricola sp.]|nr:Carbamoyl-phosphate synthase chain, ATP-binding protein [Marmoricola sp.]